MDNEAAKARFVDLMQAYAQKKVEHTRLSDAAKARKVECDHLREQLRIEALTIGISRGSKLKFEGIGTFSFTGKKHYHVPKLNRGEFARLLAGRGEHELLTVGATDLRDWCDDQADTEVALPPYVKITEDNFVPHITLTRRRPGTSDATKETQ